LFMRCTQMAALVRSCKFCADLALSCYGPLGRLKALKAAPNTPASVFTSTSGPLFQGVRPTHPFEQLLASGTAQAQHAQFGDGGLSCTFLAARLVQAALQGASTRRDIHEACCTLQAVGDRLQESLAGIASSVPQDCSLKQLLGLCRGVVRPKLGCLLDDGELEQLVALLVEAFVLTLPDAHPAGDPTAVPPAMRVALHTLRGAPLGDSRVVRGVVLPADDLPPGALRLLRPAEPAGAGAADAAGAGGFAVGEVGLLLFSGALDTRASQHDSTAPAAAAGAVVVVQEQSTAAQDDVEDEELERLVEALSQLLSCMRDVRLLMCQKGIHPAIQAWLLSRGVVPVQRLGTACVSSLSLASGCVPLEGLLDVTSVAPGRGFCHVTVDVEAINGVQLVKVQSAAASRHTSCAAATLVLGCPSDAVIEHIKHATESALKLLRVTMGQAPAAVPGCGFTEQSLAKDLEEWSTKIPGHTGRQVTLIKATAQALRDIARASTPQESDRLVQGSLHLAVCNSHKIIFDSYPCKAAALQRAVYVAIQLAKLSCQSL
ncbi:hypothetical protein Agub_g1743, partial [Astrephomene gubernaculifera]